MSVCVCRGFPSSQAWHWATGHLTAEGCPELEPTRNSCPSVTATPHLPATPHSAAPPHPVPPPELCAGIASLGQQAGRGQSARADLAAEHNTELFPPVIQRLRDVLTCSSRKTSGTLSALTWRSRDPGLGCLHGARRPRGTAGLGARRRSPRSEPRGRERPSSPTSAIWGHCVGSTLLAGCACEQH